MHEAVGALLEVLRAYLERRGDVVIPTARAAGQGRLKIAFRGLYRSIPDWLGYERLQDIIEEITGSSEALSDLESLGVRIVEVDGEPYLEVPLGLLERLRAGGG
ncbi:MAG: hypothetical protein GSR80_001113 [Desulfurococcales archaeon]|nr:hypothetical protein [Desulfurococcales archaeon]